MKHDLNIRSNEAIGARLELTRKALGVKTQKQFCEAANIQPNTYNQWIKGVTRPDLDYAWRLRDEYQISLDWIYLGDPSSMPYHLIKRIVEEIVKAQENPKSKIDSSLLITDYFQIHVR